MSLLPMAADAGLFSHKPKGPQPLGSHPSSDAKDARSTLLKQHSQALKARPAKPGKTVISQRTHPGKTLLGQPVKH
ncbi:MAG TPA: hypothetical protein VHZ99_06235 [Steroidobacteraceae bacterium]|nr:hypothetical protein [Steroidobacteraceae bacterium]